MGVKFLLVILERLENTWHMPLDADVGEFTPWLPGQPCPSDLP